MRAATATRATLTAHNNQSCHSIDHTSLHKVRARLVGQWPRQCAPAKRFSWIYREQQAARLLFCANKLKSGAKWSGRNQYRKATLIERYGPDHNMVDLRLILAADCPKRRQLSRRNQPAKLRRANRRRVRGNSDRRSW